MQQHVVALQVPQLKLTETTLNVTRQLPGGAKRELCKLKLGFQWVLQMPCRQNAHHGLPLAYLAAETYLRGVEQMQPLWLLV
eukprot:CAMPEP_0172698250 /NCGR_PEP_ID=MMETSP1074-20121228/29339_1 /TAXON_ID=2916 /ORGANISM="Ceratium fusus, Strain PA161109" /LENGTH=81 /DNA_ID=CAMNT_0013519263 /DNA_START=1 /DNA_END=246 /DNA_ORIENTATION=+